MAKLVKIAQVSDVAPGKGAGFEIEGQRIAVFNVDGQFYAIGDVCPHEGGPLCEGVVEGNEVICPWHDARFDLTNGAVTGPPADEGVKSYKVIVSGNDLQVEI